MTVYNVGPATVHDYTGGTIALQFATPPKCEGVFWYYFSHNGTLLPSNDYPDIIANVSRVTLTAEANTLLAKIEFINNDPLPLELYRMDLIAQTFQFIVPPAKID